MTTAVLSCPPPPEAAPVFGDALPTAVRYAALLAGPGVDRGLLGPRERDRVWDRHLLNCAGLSALLGPNETVLDLGSGAGLPGLVLALLRPDLTIELVEPLLRRAAFLTEAVETLALTNVTVLRARAEDLPRRGVDAVTARAVAPLGRLAEWAMPHLRPGGRLLALKGARAQAEVLESQAALTAAGVLRYELVQVGSPAAGTHASVVVAVSAGNRAATRRGTLVAGGSGQERR